MDRMDRNCYGGSDHGGSGINKLGAWRRGSGLEVMCAVWFCRHELRAGAR